MDEPSEFRCRDCVFFREYPERNTVLCVLWQHDPLHANPDGWCSAGVKWEDRNEQKDRFSAV